MWQRKAGAIFFESLVSRYFWGHKKNVNLHLLARMWSATLLHSKKSHLHFLAFLSAFSRVASCCNTLVINIQARQLAYILSDGGQSGTVGSELLFLS